MNCERKLLTSYEKRYTYSRHQIPLVNVLPENQDIHLRFSKFSECTYMLYRITHTYTIKPTFSSEDNTWNTSNKVLFFCV